MPFTYISVCYCLYAYVHIVCLYRLLTERVIVDNIIYGTNTTVEPHYNEPVDTCNELPDITNIDLRMYTYLLYLNEP